MQNTAETMDLDQTLVAALETARSQPDDPTAWDKLEADAAEKQTPEPVAELYAELLGTRLPSPVARDLGDRALAFCEEWFPDEAPQVLAVLTRLFDLDPRDEQVLDRLAMGLTAAGRWDDLLDLYEKAVDHAEGLERQAQLLDDAAKAAKDFADNADRAIVYLERLLPLRPQDAQLRASLERLLEREERWQQLIQLWDSGLVGLDDSERAADVHVRIATCWLEKLHNPPAAVDAAGTALGEHPGHVQACELLERILGTEGASAAARKRALGMLRTTYENESRPLDVARVLRVGVGFVDGTEREQLHRDAARLYRSEGEGAEALTDLGALASLRPDDDDVLEQVRELAAELGAHARHVDILVGAADAAPHSERAVELMLQAAEVAESRAGDEGRALELRSRVFAEDDPLDKVLEAGRAFDAALARLGDGRARLTVLERLARLTPDAQERRAALGSLARLHAEVHEPDRAAAVWRQRLAEDSSDREALDGLAELFESQQAWPELVKVLRERAQLEEGATAVADLGRVARVLAEQLDDLEGALRTWNEVRAIDPSALAELGVPRMLDTAAAQEADRGARLLAALGDAYVDMASDPARALGFYERALTADPAQAQARAGLQRLLDEGAVRGQAADVLASVYAKTDEVDALLELLPHRLAGAGDNGARAQLLRQAANLEEVRRGQGAVAFEHLCAAVEAAPADKSVDADLWRLAPAHDGWARLVNALAEAASGLDSTGPRYVQLQAQRGEVYERQLDDPEQALSAYLAASKAAEADSQVALAVCRVGGALGRFEEALQVLMRVARSQDAVPEELVQVLERGAEQQDAYTALCAAAERMLDVEELPGAVKRLLLGRVAHWYEQKVGDLDAAQRLLLAASKLGGAHAETLRRLAALQRRNPDRELFDTLLAVASFSDDDLDPLLEAARLATDVLQSPELAEPAWRKLWARAAVALREGRRLGGEHGAAECAVSSIWALSGLMRERGDHPAELQLLRQGGRLPLDRDTLRAFAMRAAEVARDDLGDRALAITLFRGVVDDVPDDREALAALSDLYDAEGRLYELLVVRHRELELSPPVGRRLELRMDVARVLGELEAGGGRAGALQQNLEDTPGHEASLQGLERILRGRGQLRELAQLLTRQAAQVEALGDTARAGALWNQAASVAERELEDTELAIVSHRKVAELTPTVDALDALARLHVERGDPAGAVPWLRQRLQVAQSGDEANHVRLGLARALQSAGAVDEAVDCLVEGLSSQPDAMELRDLCASLYRDNQRFEPLAALLSESV